MTAHILTCARVWPEVVAAAEKVLDAGGRVIVPPKSQPRADDRQLDAFPDMPRVPRRRR